MALLLDGFRRILIDIIVLGKEKKDVYYFRKKVTSFFDGRKIKYVHVAHTSSLVANNIWL